MYCLPERARCSLLEGVSGKPACSDRAEGSDELKAKRYPGLHIQMTTIPDEDHLTVFPSVITRGLLWALPGKERPQG
jgi:hypothetical protein